jgi:hypothetical protein
MNEISHPEIQPATWWRRLCEVTDRLFVSGDLPYQPMDPEGFQRVLDEWLDAGITHIVDLRGEANDAVNVARVAPHVSYTWLGTHDAGGDQEFSWYDRGVEAITEALDDPDARVVVHCHMGVNRAPSMAYAALLQLGHDIEEGLDAIRDARPIAKILYADSATRWFAKRSGWDESLRRDAEVRVWSWHRDNQVDVGWIISRIRDVELEAA